VRKLLGDLFSVSAAHRLAGCKAAGGMQKMLARRRREKCSSAGVMRGVNNLRLKASAIQAKWRRQIRRKAQQCRNVMAAQLGVRLAQWRKRNISTGA
jgi:hypothetical protein